MDRFIVRRYFQSSNNFQCLKSNMDRFIELKVHQQLLARKRLKSNMDRFIDFSCKNTSYSDTV
mgnify:CR=1 FL=1